MKISYFKYLEFFIQFKLDEINNLLLNNVDLSDNEQALFLKIKKSELLKDKSILLEDAFKFLVQNVNEKISAIQSIANSSFSNDIPLNFSNISNPINYSNKLNELLTEIIALQDIIPHPYIDINNVTHEPNSKRKKKIDSDEITEENNDILNHNNEIFEEVEEIFDELKYPRESVSTDMLNDFFHEPLDGPITKLK